MGLNDGVLSDLGIAPLAVASAAAVVLPIMRGFFGPSEVAQMRYEWYKQVDFVYDKYKALLPSLPKWQADVVLVDINKFWGMTHPNNVLRDGVWYEEDLGKPGMEEADFRRAFAWLEAREIAWNTMAPPLVEAALVPGMPPSELRRRIAEGTWRAAVARGELPLGVEPGTPMPASMTEAADVVTTITPSGAVVQTPAPAVVPREAGFNWPVMLAVGGVLAWLLLGKK